MRASKSPIEYSSYWRGLARTCTKCQVNRPIDAFHKDCSKTSGYFSICKKCVAIETKRWRRANEDNYRQQTRQYWHTTGKSMRAAIPPERKAEWASNRRAATKQRYKTDPKYREKVKEQVIARTRTRRGRLQQMCVSPQRSLKSVTLDREAIIDYWSRRPDYIKLYKAWKESGYRGDLGPVFALPESAPYTPKRLTVRTKAEHLRITRGAARERRQLERDSQYQSQPPQSPSHQSGA